MARHNEIGKIGEVLATELLLSKGYIIRETNWRCGKAEIDIVAEKDMRLVVVEVKTRTSDYVDATDAIDRKKMLNLVRAAKAYLQFCEVDMEVQFDIVTVIIDEAGELVEHIPDAFLPPLKSYR